MDSKEITITRVYQNSSRGICIETDVEVCEGEVYDTTPFNAIFGKESSMRIFEVFSGGATVRFTGSNWKILSTGIKLRKR